MSNLWLLALCFLAGFLARRTGKFPEATPTVLSAWVMWLALPALIISTIHAVPLRRELLLCAGALWIVFLVSAAAALVAVRFFNVSRARAGAVGLTAGLGNTAFVGLPLLEAISGREGMTVGLIVDQLGSFLVLSFVAVPFAAHMSGKHASFKQVALRLIRFPPFIALGVALITRPVAFPPQLEFVLHRLAETLSPIALAAVGWQLQLSALKNRVGVVGLALTYKLALAPLMIWALLTATSPAFGLLERVTIAQAAMAPMVTAALLAAEHDLEPELAALILGVGVPISLVTVPWVYRLL